MGDQSCIGGVCVGTDATHDPGAAGGSAGSAAGGSSGNEAMAGGATVGDSGAGGAAPECQPADVDCNGLTPISCQAGKLERSGADCAFVCKAGKCGGECKVGEKRCTGLLFEACQADNTWKPTSCASVCDASQGCVGNCTIGTLQCNGATELDECKTGSYQLKETCPVACAKVGGVVKCVACGDADGLCPAGCKSPADADCPKEPGETCAPTDQCKTGLCAAEGVCCDKACGGCSSCKLAGKVGTCSAIDYSKSADKSNCGACGNSCSTTNVTASCTGGVCGGSCTPGFAHCIAASNVGCETNINSDAANCGGCGSICPYGKCSNGCVSTHWGATQHLDHAKFGSAGQPVSLIASPLIIPTGGNLAALGVPVYFDVGDVPVHVYIALYTSSGGATPAPSTLVAQTAQLTTINGTTEGLISPQKAIAAGNYFVVIKADGPYHVQNEGASTTTSVWYNTGAISFAPFSGALSGLATASVPVLDLYAVTVP